MTEAAIIGARGEKEAVRYLRRNKFLIRELNWRSSRYEIDIIAERWGVLHFVEVKCRKAGGWSSPEEAITEHKFASLRRAAASYLGQYYFRGEHQFDLIAVEMDGDRLVDLRYIENAMQSRW
ncbi:MAG: YraN family protein [Rikenellaceae bacterium]